MDPNIAPQRVLVVEDDPGIREVMVATLQDAGYQVQTARDGAEALELLAATGEPDVITLDLNMSRMDGSTFYQALREQGLSSKVLVVSAALHRLTPYPPDFQPDAYLGKPFDLDRLIHHVGDLTQKYRGVPGS